MGKAKLACMKAMYGMNKYVDVDTGSRIQLNLISLMAAAVAAKVFKHYGIPCRGIAGYCSMDVPVRGPLSVPHVWVVTMDADGKECVTDLTYTNPGRAYMVLGEPIKVAVNAVVPTYSLEPVYAVLPARPGAPTMHQLSGLASDLDGYLNRAKENMRVAVEKVLADALNESYEVTIDRASLGLD